MPLLFIVCQMCSKRIYFTEYCDKCRMLTNDLCLQCHKTTFEHQKIVKELRWRVDKSYEK